MSVQYHAQRLVDAMPADTRAALAADPVAGIATHCGLRAQPAETFDQRGAGGWCDGVSITSGTLILYRPTRSRRRHYTLLHEVGHHVAENDDDCVNWLADRPDPDRTLEQVCDAFAARLLLPDQVVAAALQSGPPSAEALARLYEMSAASRSACAVGIASRLGCEGFVAIIDRDQQEVFFAARRGDTRPYAWRGDRVPDGHPLNRPDPPAASVAWWPYPDGEQRRYFLSALAAEDYTYAVFAEGNLWNVPGFHLPDTAREDRGYDGTVTCRTCGYSGATRSWPCPQCHQPHCPRCEECECDRRKRRETRSTCVSCTVSVRAHLLDEAGRCPDCR